MPLEFSSSRVRSDQEARVLVPRAYSVPLRGAGGRSSCLFLRQEMATSELRSRKQDGKAAESAAASAASAGVKGDEKATAPAGSIDSKSKPRKILVLACLVCGPAVALFLSMDISFQQRRSIFINFVMSVLAFCATRYLIPVAIPYVLKRNMFGMDINKRGSPGGEIKMSVLVYRQALSHKHPAPPPGLLLLWASQRRRERTCSLHSER